MRRRGGDDAEGRRRSSRFTSSLSTSRGTVVEQPARSTGRTTRNSVKPSTYEELDVSDSSPSPVKSKVSVPSKTRGTPQTPTTVGCRTSRRTKTPGPSLPADDSTSEDGPSSPVKTRANLRTPVKTRTPVKSKTPVRPKTPVKSKTPVKPKTPATLSKARTSGRLKTPAGPAGPFVEVENPVIDEDSPPPAPKAKTPLKSPFKSPGKVGSSAWRFNSLGVPKCPLPCRESQFEEIWTFLHENISSRGSRCLYVSGVPGTGKTVIVQSVVDTLTRYANERKEHLKFNFVYINGLSLSSPDKIWKRFYCELKGEKIKLTPQTALKKLGSYFETKGRLPTVLVIDELDQILDKKQSILYHLLEWSSHASTTFSLVAIFNTMSLPENGLVMRNVSRIGLTRCIFPPYTHEQLQTIIKNSLAPCKSEKVKDEAIILLSRKVAAVSGDARRALEIAKRTIEIVEAGSGAISGMKAVDGAFKEIFSSPKIDTLKNCTALEQMLLENLANELQRNGSEETTLITLYNNLSSSAAYDGMSWSVDQFVNASTRLSLMKLAITEMNSSSIHKKISLNVPVEDLKYAFGLKSAAVE